MTHPLHPFHTGREEVDAVVVGEAAMTNNLCSYCRNETISNLHPAFQCHPCGFNLCSTCAQTEGYAHAAHTSHYLCLVNIVDEIWKCNGCNNSSPELKDTSCYFCSFCKFYLCRKCFEPKRSPLHEHDLTKTDVRSVYHRSNGGWICNCCGKNNGLGHYLPRHCNLCRYDLCEKCCQPHRSTLHLHDLYKADSELAYQRFSGGWRCDSCESRFRPSTNKYPYHCEICEFDLCDNCMTMTSDSKVPRRSSNINYRGMGAPSQTEDYAHAAHISHHLRLVNIVDEIWKCNGCNNSSREIKDTSCYFCSYCKFYLCRKCFEPKRSPLHEHDLTKTDVRSVYHRSNGGWICDCCGRNNGLGHYLPRHCNLCRYDLCEKCCQPHRSTLHLHDLYKADSELAYQRFSGGWRCDSCESRFRPSTNKYPYHCEICEFDLCDNCMTMTSDSKVPRRSTNVNHRGIGTTTAGFPLASPEEELKDVEGSDPPPEDTLCIICMTEPKNATIIHGETGHVCCCLFCAKKLKSRGDPCPICREPIQLVIKQFLA